MLEIRNRKILLSKINLCKSDVIIGDCAHRVYNKSEKFCRMCFVKEEFIWRRQNRCKQSTVFCFNINYWHKIVLQYDLMY